MNDRIYNKKTIKNMSILFKDVLAEIVPHTNMNQTWLFLQDYDKPVPFQHILPYVL